MPGASLLAAIDFFASRSDSNKRGEYPETSLLSEKMQGAFDSAGASLREVPAPLRMTIWIRVADAAQVPCCPRLGRARTPVAPLYLLFYRLGVEFLNRFASGQALGYDQAAGFYAQGGEGASEPDGAEDAGYASDGDRDGRADVMG